ncbi:MAG: hypothetical protein INR62_08290 [Rhodospirillales bacterium]|nr:hypothetical protein [Acetobacter sp.]
MSITSPYRVHVIVDPASGRRLADLPADEPVWIVAGPINEPIVRQLWQQRLTKSHLDGITMFRSHGSPEDAFLGELGTVDLHHGEYSAQPPYSLLEVVGCPPSEEVRSALTEFGFSIIASSPEGFSAQRPIPVA